MDCLPIQCGGDLATPIILSILFRFHLPVFYVKILNALFLFASIIFFYKTLAIYFKERYATIGAFLFGLYPPFLRQLHLIYTENLTVFLICGFTYFFFKINQNYRTSQKHSWGDIFFASLFLGYFGADQDFFRLYDTCGTDFCH